METRRQRIHSLIELEQKKLNNRVDLRISDEITNEHYLQIKSQIEKNLTQFKKEQSGLEYTSNDWVKQVEKRINFANNALSRFREGSYEDKTIIHEFRVK